MHRLILLAVAACAGSTPRPIDNRNANPPMRLEITLTRTMCFGTCPAYTVTIHGDTRVDWTGQQYVDAVGERHGRTSQAELDALAATIDRIAFFHLDEHGARPAAPMANAIICSDTPRAIVTVNRNGQTHTTTNNDHCTAAPVDALEDQIDAAAHTSPWIGTGHK